MDSPQIRVGIGYDVHKIRKGGPLRLGGIDIPAEIELEGHSDADVLVHAIIDAIFGAAGLGDIGDHFPPSDPAYRGIDSLILLQNAKESAAAKGFQIINIDATVIAEAPRLGAYKKAMAVRLCGVLGLAEGAVNIKATTNETMGFVGRQEGLAALAVALLQVQQNG